MRPGSPSDSLQTSRVRVSSGSRRRRSSTAWLMRLEKISVQFLFAAGKAPGDDLGMGIEHGGTQKAVLEILQGHDVPRLRIAENFAHFRAVNPVVPLKMRALGEIIKPAMSGKAIHDRGGKFKGNAGGSQKGRGKGGGLRSLGFSRKYAAVHHSGTISVENARKRSKIGRVMKVETFETPQDAAKALAGEVAELIRTRAAEGKTWFLALPRAPLRCLLRRASPHA